MKRTLVRSVVIAASSSAGVTSAVMPTVIRRLKKLDRLDRPNARSSHKLPTPRGGGLACAVGVVAGLASARAVGLPVPMTVTAGVLGMAALGYIDDRVSLSATVRLGGQVVSGAAAGALLGGTVPAIAAGAVVVPVAVNSFNFMDGINGISAGQIAVWAGSTVPHLVATGAVGELSIVASVLGAGLSFLPWNVPEARVFLGDVGSYLFGSAIAFVTLSRFVRREGTLGVLVAPYSLYLADTGWTLLRRFRSGKRLTDAHRDHVYQALSDLKGIEHWQVAAGVAGSGAVCAVLARKSGAALGIPAILAGYLSSPFFLSRAS